MATPASVPVDGMSKVLVLPTAADIDAITVAEATAGEDISCYLTGDGWQPSGDQATISDSRLCTTQDFEQPGRKTESLTIRYTFNTEVPASDEARLALAEGTVGVILKRSQVAYETVIAAGDFYEAYPFKAGVQRILPPEANAVDRIEQKLFVTGPVARFAVIAA